MRNRCLFWTASAAVDRGFCLCLRPLAENTMLLLTLRVCSFTSFCTVFSCLTITDIQLITLSRRINLIIREFYSIQQIPVNPKKIIPHHFCRGTIMISSILHWRVQHNGHTEHAVIVVDEKTAVITLDDAFHRHKPQTGTMFLRG